MHTGVYPGIDPRLMIATPGRESLESYLARGGYAVGLEGESLIEAVDSADLRGRGGAGFPMALKLRSILDRPHPRYGVANGEEGEPISVKDRWLLRARPHLVLDGLLRCCRATGVEKGWVYVSDPGSERSVRAAIGELGTTGIPVDIVRVDPGYVAGEASSVVRAMNGGPAKPTDKPPFPFDEGVGGSTTLISNVETLANIPFIAGKGASEYRRVGAGGRLGTGTVLMTLSGACARPGLYEVPLGLPLGPTVDTLAGLGGGVRGFVMGGFFAGLANARALDFPISHAEMVAEGSGLGCGAVVVLGRNDCPVSAAADVLAYLAAHSAGQCGPCIKGTPAMAGVVSALTRGEASEDDLTRLDRWSHSLRGRGACGLLDGACNVAASLFREFPEDVASHRHGPCDRCAARPVEGKEVRAGAADDSLVVANLGGLSQ